MKARLLLSVLLLATSYGAMAADVGDTRNGDSPRPVVPREILAQVPAEQVKLPGRIAACANTTSSGMVPVALRDGVLVTHLPRKEVQRCRLWPGATRPQGWGYSEHLAAWEQANGLAPGALRGGGDRRLALQDGAYYPIGTVSNDWVVKVAREHGLLPPKKEAIATHHRPAAHLVKTAAMAPQASGRTPSATLVVDRGARAEKPTPRVLSVEERAAAAARVVTSPHFPISGVEVSDPDGVQVVRIPGICERVEGGKKYTQQSCFAVYVGANPVTGLGGHALMRDGVLYWVGPAAAGGIDVWAQLHTTNLPRYQTAKKNRTNLAEQHYRYEAEVAAQQREISGAPRVATMPRISGTF